MSTGGALGVLEARGMAAVMASTDAMLKAADVALSGRHGIGSGWVTVVVSGSVADVESAMRVGADTAAEYGELILARVIARPDTEVMEHLPHAQAMGGKGEVRALGVLETQGLAPLIVGADAMSKAAAVALGGWAFIGGALCHVWVSGDVAAVQVALAAGRAAAASVGAVHADLLLAQPDPGLDGLVPAPTSTAVPDATAALGILETTGYVATVAGTDAMVKAADVGISRLVLGSGGRSIALVRGQLDAVGAAIRAAQEVVPRTGELNAAQVLARPDVQTVRCFAALEPEASATPAQGAMGLIETRTTIGLVKAMDAMLKAAAVEYAGSYKVGYFLTASVIRGDVGAVRFALDVGAVEAARFGELVAVHLIPHPYPELQEKLVHR